MEKNLKSQAWSEKWMLQICPVWSVWTLALKNRWFQKIFSIHETLEFYLCVCVKAFKPALSHLIIFFPPFFCLPCTHAPTLSACRVFVSGAPAPAVSWLLLAHAVLQALSKVGDCGCGMCWLSTGGRTCPHLWALPPSASCTFSSWFINVTFVCVRCGIRRWNWSTVHLKWN